MPGPFDWTNTINLMPQPFSAQQLARMRSAAPSLDQMGVVLVDVSRGGLAAFALNFKKTGFAASLPKIAAMYAAYYFQDRLRASSLPLIGMKLSEVESTLKKDWGHEIRAKLPRSTGDFPDITWIFKNTKFDFSNAFRKNLIDMIQVSDNYAAGSVIRRVGYDYLNAVLVHGGLYSVNDASGLWIGDDYTKSTRSYNRDGKRAPGLKTSVAASAEATALLLVNLALDRLISARASTRMKNLMNNASSWVRDEIQGIHPEAEVFGKVGYVKNSTHDCAIVRHNDAHYVVVTLFGRDNLNPLFVELDVLAQQLFQFRKVAEFVKSMIHP